MLLSKFLNLSCLRYINFLYLAIAFSLVIPQNVNGAQLSKIEARGKLIVGIKDNLRPLGYSDANGKLQGFEIDIARRLAKELLGDTEAVKLVPVLNQNRLQVVIDDEVDLAIASVSVNPSRQRLVNFSYHYFLSGTGIIVKKSSLPINLRSFSGKIGVLQNSRAISELQYNLPDITLTPVSSYQQALTLIEKGEIQGFAGDITVLTGWMQEQPEYQLLPQIWGGYPLAVVLPKGRQYQSLRDKVNRIMRNLKQEGWLEERAKYWGLPVDK